MVCVSNPVTCTQGWGLQEASKTPQANCSKIAGLGPLMAKKPYVTE